MKALLSALLLSSFGTLTVLQAEPILTVFPSVTLVNSGYEYRYEVSFAGAGNGFTFRIESSNLELIADSALGPSGWLVFEAPNEVLWLSLDSSTDLSSGVLLGGFSFRSTAASGRGIGSMDFLDPTSGLYLESQSIETIAPVGQIVPEPSSWVMLLLGVGLLIGAHRSCLQSKTTSLR